MVVKLKDTILTVREASQVLRVSYMTVYKWCLDGYLPSLKMGGRRLILEGQLEGFLRKVEQASAKNVDHGMSKFRRTQQRLRETAWQ